MKGHVVVENRTAALRYAHEHAKPFVIERQDVDELPGLLSNLPHVPAIPDGYTHVASLAKDMIATSWRSFILLGHAYGILPNSDIGRFRSTKHFGLHNGK